MKQSAVNYYLKDDVLIAIAVGTAKRVAVVGGRSSVEDDRLLAGEGDVLLHLTPLGGGRSGEEGGKNRSGGGIINGGSKVA